MLYTRTSNSVIPEPPKNLHLAQRNNQLPHINKAEKYNQTWVLTGAFSDTSKTNTQTLKKILCFYVDFDLADTIANDSAMFDVVVQYLKDNHFTSFYKAKGNVFTEKKITDHLDDKSSICKLFVSVIPVDQIKALTERFFKPILNNYIIPYLGKPSKITFTGHGSHAYYWLDDDEGFTAGNAKDWKKYVKSVFKQCNDKLGYNAIDSKVSDLGTRCTREIGTYNNKNSMYPKQVVLFLHELTEFERRVKLDSCKPVPVPENKKKADTRYVAPKRLQSDNKVSILVQGTAHIITVEQLFNEFKDISEAQAKDGSQVRDIRLIDEIGAEGSHASFATLTEDNKLFIFLKVGKYRKQNDTHWKQAENGEDVAHYLYDGTTFELQRNEKGNVIKNAVNLCAILQNDKRTKNKFYYNSRLEQVSLHKDVHLQVFGNVEKEKRISRVIEWFKFRDEHYILFEQLFNDYGINSVTDQSIQRYVKFSAMLNAHDPVAEWIESIDYDGVPRLESWLPAMLNLPADHPKYAIYSAYGRAVMLGITRMIYVGNTHADVQHVICLAGKQGIGKSLFASVIAGTEYIGMDYFHDSGIDISNNAHKGDVIASMLGCTVIELPESISLSNNVSDQAIKAFLTTKKDKGRFAFGREQTEKIRATYFVTNSNDQIFLSDPTGNRRYLVVDLFEDLKTQDGRLDIAYLRSVLPQLYAEAYKRVVLGECIPEHRQQYMKRYESDLVEDWNLTKEESDAQELHNHKFLAPDYVAELLHDILADELERGINAVSFSEIKAKARDIDASAVLSNRGFAQAMTRCGWKKARQHNKNVWIPTSKAVHTAPRNRIYPIEA